MVNDEEVKPYATTPRLTAYPSFKRRGVWNVHILKTLTLKGGWGFDDVGFRTVIT